MSMPSRQETPYKPGDTVAYHPYRKARPLTATVVRVHEDGSADLIYVIPGQAFQINVYEVFPLERSSGTGPYFVVLRDDPDPWPSLAL